MLNPYLEQRLYSQPVQPVLIEFDPNFLNQLMAQITGLRLPVTNSIPSFGFIALAPATPSVIKRINGLPGVRVVHADLMKTIFQLPTASDDWFPTSESRKMLEAEEAYKVGFTGEPIKVGVTDTGIDATHPQLIGTPWYSTIAWPAREVLDENGHGTHVCSTVAGKLYHTELGVTVEGVSKAPMVSVKCLGRGIGTGFTSEIINAMSTAYNKGAQVISMSLGSAECQGGCEICPECRMVSTLTNRGLIVVVAAGNAGPKENTIGCPGCNSNALTVAAVDRTGKIADFSSRGGSQFPFKPDVAGPGVNIYSGTARGSVIDVQEAREGFGWASISGTSMATPHISGFVSLVKHFNPKLTTADFKNVMAGRGHAKDFQTGWGIPKWSYFYP